MKPTILDITWIFTESLQVYANIFVLCIPIFFFWRWVLRRYISSYKKRLVATVLVTILSSSLIYAGFVLCVISTINYEPQKDFNTTAWSQDRQRYEMADDLINQKVLVGKDSTDLKAILGVPNRRTDSTYEVQLRNCWMYGMGMGPWGFGVKFHLLIVKFDGNKVIAVTRGGTVD